MHVTVILPAAVPKFVILYLFLSPCSYHPGLNMGSSYSAPNLRPPDGPQGRSLQGPTRSRALWPARTFLVRCFPLSSFHLRIVSSGLFPPAPPPPRVPSSRTTTFAAFLTGPSPTGTAPARLPPFPPTPWPPPSFLFPDQHRSTREENSRLTVSSNA